MVYANRNYFVHFPLRIYELLLRETGSPNEELQHYVAQWISCTFFLLFLALFIAQYNSTFSLLWTSCNKIELSLKCNSNII